MYCPSDCMEACVLIFFVAYLYGDFFAPPPKSRGDKGKGRAVPDDSSAPSRDSKVRFHEEVRVKMVKSHGNMTSLYDAESDSDNEDTDESDTSDQDERGVAGSPEEDDGEEDEVGEESDESGDSEGGEDSGDEDAFETMERFKDDLFADEEQEQTGKLFLETYRNMY